MNKTEPTKKTPFRAALSAFLIIGTVCIFALASLFGGTDSPVWYPLLALHDRTHVMLGTDTVGDVYVTPERLLRRRVQYSEEDLKDAAAAINRFSGTTDIPVWFMGVPTSAGIYADTLSDAAPRVNERALLRSLSEQLDPNVSWLEAASWLNGMKEQYVYYRTDSRWTSYGAYYIYQSVIRKLGFQAIGYDHFVITHFSSDYYGNLAQEIRYFDLKPDLVDIYTAENEPAPRFVTAYRSDGTSIPLQSYYRKEEAEESGDAYDVFGMEHYPVLQMEMNNKSSKHLLLLSDSSGSPMLPFLWQHYHNITAVNMSLTDGMDWRKLTKDQEYSHIIILCSTDTLLDPHGLDALRISGS